MGKDISYTHTLTLGGDVTLILKDGKTMNVTTTGDEHEDYCINAPDGQSLHIYGQTEGTGTLNAQTQGDANGVIHIEGGTLGIYGGNVTATVGGIPNYLQAICVQRATAGDALVIDRGTLTANGKNGHGIYIEGGDAHINGGQVEATGAKAGITVLDAVVDESITIPGILTLSGGTLTASGFNTYSGESCAGTLAVAPGLTYTDGTSLYDSTTETATLAALGGKTLQPCLALADAASNTAAIADHAGQTLAVALSGRTLYKDGSWNTLCLPFDVTVSGSALDGDGVTIMTLNGETSSLDANGLLTLNFTDVTTGTLTAGTPYIIKWAKADGYDAASEDTRDISNPTFTGVTVKNDAPTAVSFSNALGDDCQFVGQYSPFSITDGNINEIVMLSANNTLGYSKNPRTLRSCRAHFLVPTTTSNAPAMARYAINFGDDESTGITTTNYTNYTNSDEWYTLDGRKLDGKPTAAGLYINNGKKIIIK